MYKIDYIQIKWAGGKTQLINILRRKYPEKINCYCKPFVGGGAILFDVLANIKRELLGIKIPSIESLQF